MEIYCICHPNQTASYLCIDCGFLCEQHKAEETQRDHSLLTINKAIASLFSAMVQLQKASMLSAAVLGLKKKVIGFLNKESNTYEKHKATNDTLMKNCKSEKFAVDPNIVSGHISKLLSKNENMSQSISNTLINQLITLLNETKINSNKASQSTDDVPGMLPIKNNSIINHCDEIPKIKCAETTGPKVLEKQQDTPTMTLTPCNDEAEIAYPKFNVKLDEAQRVDMIKRNVMKYYKKYVMNNELGIYLQRIEYF